MDCPDYSVSVLGDRLTQDEVLQIIIPAQVLPDRGRILPHLVRGRLRDTALELRLYLAVSRIRLIDVGVWALGDYVHWEHERERDFVVIDAVDSCLRAQLPPGGGVPTFKRGPALGASLKAAFSFRP